MKKVMLVFGTRPEAIKLAPVIRELKLHSSLLKTAVCVTGQHREMLDQVLRLFNIEPDYDMNIMSENQDLFDVAVNILSGIKEILKKEQPDLILVQGDTNTAFIASLAAFYLMIPIGHIEAGLRTYDKYQPFPEEKNRHLTAALADYHFAPTEWARENLLKENTSAGRIWVTGNTGIDALLSVVHGQENAEQITYWEKYFEQEWGLDLRDDERKIILITGHRRESFGTGFENICHALKKISQKNSGLALVYPVHLNPNVRKPVFDILGAYNGVGGNNSKSNIYLIEPLDYAPFVYLMNRSYFILTDSGGIQEEAPSLGKPVLVMRDNTERPEGVRAGSAKLVGTDSDRIMSEVQTLLEDVTAYKRMASVRNPFGDGTASQKIVKIISDYLC